MLRNESNGKLLREDRKIPAPLKVNRNNLIIFPSLVYQYNPIYGRYNHYDSRLKQLDIET